MFHASSTSDLGYCQRTSDTSSSAMREAKLRSACGSDSHWRKRVALCCLHKKHTKNIQKLYVPMFVYDWNENEDEDTSMIEDSCNFVSAVDCHIGCVPNDFGCVVSVHSRKLYVRVTNAPNSRAAMNHKLSAPDQFVRNACPLLRDALTKRLISSYWN